MTVKAQLKIFDRKIKQNKIMIMICIDKMLKYLL